MKYTFTGEDALRLAAFVGAQTRDDGDEIQFLYCPYCHGGAHKDKYTFAVNRQSGKFNCLRAKCQKQGHFVTLARDMGFALDFGRSEEHTSELQSRFDLVCRLLLEKKKRTTQRKRNTR